MKHLLRCIAARAEARVFCVAGARFRDDARFLRLCDGIRLVPTPREANILLIVGELDAGLVAPSLVCHDALSQPRATVWWPLETPAPLVNANFPGALEVPHTDPVAFLRKVHESLVMRLRHSEAASLPDVEPAPWRGVGPYGQGGKAMTGGVPYGRPMAARAEDRDGLKLDYLPLRIGPLFAPFPVGLALDVRLQGDLIQQVTVENFADPVGGATTIFGAALQGPVPIRDLELARARSHLRWVSDAVTVAGSASLSERILRFAERVGPGDQDEMRALRRQLGRRGFVGWNTRGIGLLSRDQIEDVTGPVARASGLAIDARSEDPAYLRIGFEPEVQEEADAAARWVQRLDEAAQALELASRAGDAITENRSVVESPRGALSRAKAPSQAIADLIPSLIEGMEWGDAITTIVSLDLDMSEAHDWEDSKVTS